MKRIFAQARARHDIMCLSFVEPALFLSNYNLCYTRKISLINILQHINKCKIVFALQKEIFSLIFVLILFLCKKEWEGIRSPNLMPIKLSLLLTNSMRTLYIM